MLTLILGGQFIALTVAGAYIFGGQFGWHPVPAILLSLILSCILPSLMVRLFGKFILLIVAGAYGALGFHAVWEVLPGDYWSSGAAGAVLAALAYIANKAFYFDSMPASGQHAGVAPMEGLPHQPHPQPDPEDMIDPDALQSYFEGALGDLAKARAISPDAYLKAMLKIDPDFDPRRARLENLPVQAPQDDAERELRDLYDADLISFEDFQAALEEIDKVSPSSVVSDRRHG